MGLAMACLHPGHASRARPRWVPGPGCPVRMIWMLMEFTSLRSRDANLALADDSDSDSDSDARVPIPAMEPIRQRFRPAMPPSQNLGSGPTVPPALVIWPVVTPWQPGVAYGIDARVSPIGSTWWPALRHSRRLRGLPRPVSSPARCCLWNRRSCQSRRDPLAARCCLWAKMGCRWRCAGSGGDGPGGCHLLAFLLPGGVRERRRNRNRNQNQTPKPKTMPGSPNIEYRSGSLGGMLCACLGRC